MPHATYPVTRQDHHSLNKYTAAALSKHHSRHGDKVMCQEDKVPAIVELTFQGGKGSE